MGGWQPDLIIAATALEHGLTLVSRDLGDYERARVPGTRSMDGVHVRAIRARSPSS